MGRGAQDLKPPPQRPFFHDDEAMLSSLRVAPGGGLDRHGDGCAGGVDRHGLDECDSES